MNENNRDILEAFKEAKEREANRISDLREALTTLIDTERFYSGIGYRETNRKATLARNAAKNVSALIDALGKEG